MEIGHPITKQLNTILKEIDGGEVKIPEFQRDFRWEVGDIADLVVSLLKGFPAGVLLFWDVRNKPERLPDRCTEGVGEESERRETEYQILDGQQRLTSLYQLLYLSYVTTRGGRKAKFFLDLEEIRKGELDDCVKSFSEREINKQRLEEDSEQTKRKLLPLEILLDDNGLRIWKHKYVLTTLTPSKTDPPEMVEEIEKNKSEFDSTFLDRDKPIFNLRNYEFHIITLPPTLSLDAVTTIFEKLNTTGQALNVFEILTAKLYKDVKLREMWSTAKEENPLIADFSKDEKDTSLAILLLKAILLKKSMEESKMAALECKRKNLLENLEAKDINKHWENLAESFERSINKLREEYGCVSVDYLPYSTMLVPFSLAINHIESRLKIQEKGEAFKKTEQWYWTSVFSERYDQGTDSKSKSDTTKLIAWFNNESEKPVEIKQFSCDALDLKNTTRGAAYKGILNILVRNGIKDFCSSELISAIVKEKPKDVDVHHLFPREYIKRKYGEKSEQFKIVDSILNKTLIENETNRQYIKDDQPSVYYERIRRHNTEINAVLEKHLVPFKEFKSDDFDRFMDSRCELITNEIKKNTASE